MRSGTCRGGERRVIVGSKFVACDVGERATYDDRRVRAEDVHLMWST